MQPDYAGTCLYNLSYVAYGNVFFMAYGFICVPELEYYKTLKIYYLSFVSLSPSIGEYGLWRAPTWLSGLCLALFLSKYAARNLELTKGWRRLTVSHKTRKNFHRALFQNWPYLEGKGTNNDEDDDEPIMWFINRRVIV